MARHAWRKIEVKDKLGRPHYRCAVCTLVAALPAGKARAVAAAMPDCPGWFVMPPHNSLQYAARVTRWSKAGMPTRSAEAVAAIYGTACAPCEYRSGESVCLKAQSRVLPSGPPNCNLVAMATEECPVGKWGDDAVPAESRDRRVNPEYIRAAIREAKGD